MGKDEIAPELAKLARKLKVEVRTPYDHGDKVESVRFKFKSKVWADLANKEGELLPCCCANVSAIRDSVTSAMREDGWMDTNELQSLVVNMSGHEYAADHPVTLMSNVYEALKPHLHFNLMGQPGDIDVNDPDKVCSSVWFSQIWKYCADYAHASMCSGWGTNFHDQAAHNYLLSQLIPIVKTLGEKIHKTGFPPVEGYSLIRRATGLPFEMSRGPAFFGELKDAERVLGDWITTKQVEAYDAEVRAVRVTWEKGLEILSEVKNKWSHPEAQATKEELHNVWDGVNALRDKNKNDKIEAILLETIDKVKALRGGEAND